MTATIRTLKPSHDAAADIVDASTMRRLALEGEATRIREHAKASRRGVARALGVHHTTLSRWEAGTASPRTEVAVAWLRLLREIERVAA